MKKLVLATALATMASVSFADVMISGKYEGKMKEDSTTGNYTYTSDLDLTLKGKVGDTVMTSTFENIGKKADKSVLVKQVFIETPIGDIAKFKGGTYKYTQGKGLLQESTTKDRMNISSDFGPVGVGLTQVSNTGDTEVTLSTNLGPVSVKIDDATEDTRFITATGELGGAKVVFESQEYSAGKTNMGISAGASVGDISLTGVYLDVQDTAGVFQTDGILGDVSDANSGTTVTGVVASTKVDFGTVTGKYITKNDINSMVGQLQVGNWKLTATKPENADAKFEASLKVKF